MKSLFTSIIIILCVLSTHAQEWQQVSNMPIGFRTHHSFAFAIDDVGYVTTGGSITGNRNEFFSYNAFNDEWTQLDDFPGSARAFAIGDVYDGKAYFGFGSNGAEFADLWVFDPTTMQWTELATCPCAPRNHPAFVANNNMIFMGLGNNNTSGNLNDWWQYDIINDSWEQKADLPSDPRHHPYQFAIGEYVYTGFGHGNGFISNEWFRYDPSTDEWLQLSNLPAEGRVAGTQFSFEDIGYVLSGDGSDHASMEEGEFWSYDPGTDEWMQLTSHPGKSRWAPASFIIDGEIYLINGMSQVGADYQFIQEVYKFPLRNTSATFEAELGSQVIKSFPNPVEDILYLDLPPEMLFKNSEINIFNSSNQLVKKSDLNDVSVDVNGYHPGQYWYTISNAKTVYHGSFIKL